MKSVKNFFIERLHGSEPIEQTDYVVAESKSKLNFKSNITAGDDKSPTVLIQSSHDDNTTPPTSTTSEDSRISPFDFSSSKTVMKPKTRRKISLPWSRQTSITKNLVLSRQHTIDSPGSFHLTQQQSGCKSKVGTYEATWVISDYIALAGSNKLTVTKGQQVEIVEAPTSAEPDFCLVRLNPPNDDGVVQEGFVPISILKPSPVAQKATFARKEKCDSGEQSNSRGKSDPLTSSTKRRGLGGRKWLPQIGRKPTQHKIEKPPEKALTKKLSEKNFKLPAKQTDDNSMIASTSPMSSTAMSQLNTSQQELELDEEVGLELPPPMKPIQEPHIIANGPPAFTKDTKDNPTALANAGKMNGLSEIEQIVKEKTEKHEEKSKILSGSSSRLGTAACGGNSTGMETCSNADLVYPNNENNTSKNSGENSYMKSSEIESTHKCRLPALTELISTEELYIKDLGDIVNGYIAELRNANSDIIMPNDLKSPKWLIVFANIEAIYEWHRDSFLKLLLQCQKSPGDLGSMIKHYEHKFQMYITYCNNKPKSEHIVTEHVQYFDQVRQKLGHRLDLSDLLIKPVQRLTKYVLLLNTITKQIEQAGMVEEVPSMKEACNVMNAICKNVNDTMVLQRLKNFDGKITAQGKLLLHGSLTCIENARNATERKMREMHVFIFEQSILFTEKHNSKIQFSSPTYVYKSHIQVNKMQLEELPNNRFLLKSTDPNRPDLNMICHASTIETYREWLDTIRKQLQIQHDFLNALTRPIAYQQQQQAKGKQHSDMKHEHNRE